MDKEVLKSIDEDTRKAIIFVIKQYYKSYLKIVTFDEMFIYAYLEILEKQKQSKKQLDFYRIESTAHCAINRLVNQEIRKSKRCLSIEANIETNNEKSENTIEYLLKDETEPGQIIIACELEEQIKRFIINNYTKSEQEIIFAYIQSDKKIKNLSQRLKLKEKKIKELITNFLNSLNKYLLEIGQIKEQIKIQVGINYACRKYINKNKDRLADKKRRLKKKGIFIYNDDKLIYKLCREYPNKQELIKALAIDENFFEKVITRSIGCAKLFLYQIQKLRKLFFQKYNLNTLLEPI